MSERPEIRMVDKSGRVIGGLLFCRLFPETAFLDFSSRRIVVRRGGKRERFSTGKRRFAFFRFCLKEEGKKHTLENRARREGV